MRPIVLFFAIAMLPTAAMAQKEGYVYHFVDGTSLQCPFDFSSERNVYWSHSSPPPITLDEANRFFQEWQERRYPGANSLVQSYRLEPVRPFGADHSVWSYFLRYLVVERSQPIASDDQFQTIAITMNGSVIEAECDAS